ncbi:DUF485 domain-containing protein [Azovibrio restrictus]|uniref:DUF485 domain-containing protein n=1 Tax=Azovibrio restrictus TaxID=146938 RepID=UPI0026EBABAE|nr:DUF485 domain-containing protein [Azovibrio restrictus]MDD3481698.1 DUF485 domain-containing protein [Azovibrio restrictus]
MSSSVYARIRENPKFQDLVARRSRYSWTLSAIVVLVFYGFVMVVAFNPKLIGQPVAEGSMWTIGIAFGLLIFISFWLMTAVYVHRANGEFDRMSQEVVQSAWKENQ